MAEQTRTVLKSYFETGDYPTQTNFSDLIDSVYNKTDDVIDAHPPIPAPEDIGKVPVANDNGTVAWNTLAGVNGTYTLSLVDTITVTNGIITDVTLLP